jgi:hypothetical protein
MRTVMVARNGRSPEHATVEIARGCHLVCEDVRLFESNRWPMTGRGYPIITPQFGCRSDCCDYFLWLVTHSAIQSFPVDVVFRPFVNFLIFIFYFSNLKESVVGDNGTWREVLCAWKLVLLVGVGVLGSRQRHRPAELQSSLRP